MAQKSQHESVIDMNISYLTFEPLSHLPPIPPLYADTEPLFEFPEPCNKFLLAIYFTYGNVSSHVTLSIHLTLFSPLPMSISLFSMSLHCCPVNKFFNMIFLDSVLESVTYVLEYGIYLILI